VGGAWARPFGKPPQLLSWTSPKARCGAEGPWWRARLRRRGDSRAKLGAWQGQAVVWRAVAHHWRGCFDVLSRKQPLKPEGRKLHGLSSPGFRQPARFPGFKSAGLVDLHQPRVRFLRLRPSLRLSGCVRTWLQRRPSAIQSPRAGGEPRQIDNQADRNGLSTTAYDNQLLLTVMRSDDERTWPQLLLKPPPTRYRPRSPQAPPPQPPRRQRQLSSSCC